MGQITTTTNNTLQSMDSISIRAKESAYASKDSPYAPGAREESAQYPLNPVNGDMTAHDWQADEKLRKALETLQIEYGVKVELASDDTGKIFIRIMSEDGEKILRQMPPDSLIKLQANLKQSRGLLADWLA